MSTPIKIEPAKRGVYLRASRLEPVARKSFAGGVILVDFAADASVVGLMVMRLGSIELQVLSDIARTYDLDLGSLLTIGEPETVRETELV